MYKFGFLLVLLLAAFNVKGQKTLKYRLSYYQADGKDYIKDSTVYMHSNGRVTRINNSDSFNFLYDTAVTYYDGLNQKRLRSRYMTVKAYGANDELLMETNSIWDSAGQYWRSHDSTVNSYTAGGLVSKVERYNRPIFHTKLVPEYTIMYQYDSASSIKHEEKHSYWDEDNKMFRTIEKTEYNKNRYSGIENMVRLTWRNNLNNYYEDFKAQWNDINQDETEWVQLTRPNTAWKNSSKYRLKYVNGGLMEKIHSYGYFDSMWKEHTIYQYDKDSYGRDSIITTKGWNPVDSSWRDEFRSVNLYDSNGNVILNSTYERDAALKQMFPKSITENIYDEQNRFVRGKYMFYNLVLGWTNRIIYTYTFNKASGLIESLVAYTESVSDSSISDIWKIEASYDNNYDLTNMIAQFWDTASKMWKPRKNSFKQVKYVVSPPYISNYYNDMYKIDFIYDNYNPANSTPGHTKNPIKLTVYPNPANKCLYVEYTTENIKPTQYIIRDINGRIYKSAVSGELSVKINTEELSTGLYFLSVYAEGRLIGTERFVKE